MDEYFQRFRSNLELNQTTDQTIQARHSAVRSAIVDYGLDRPSKLIGSLQRKTRIQPRPEDTIDIDILVNLGKFEGWAPAGISPAAALSALYGEVCKSDRYSTKSPLQDAPTVTLTFSDNVTVELVPAYEDGVGCWPDGTPVRPMGRGYWVPKGGRWEYADYDFEAEYITAQNRQCGGLLVPAIKMLKAARRLHFPVLRSFPLEILAADIIPPTVGFLSNLGPVSYADLLWHFFGIAKATASASLRIPGSNSPPVLIDASVLAGLKNAFVQIERFIESTRQIGNRRDQANAWRRLFGDAFPASV